MSDSNIAINEPTVGDTDKRVDTEQLTVNSVVVERERVQLAGVGPADIARIGVDEGLKTNWAPTLAARTAGSSVALAVGASDDIDGATIPSGVTGKLMGVTLASSGAAKWEIKTRDGGVEITIDVVLTGGFYMPTFMWKPPHKDFATLAGAGVNENFRITVTNLDTFAADYYATMFWDEV